MTKDRGRLLFDESQHSLFRRRSIGSLASLIVIAIVYAIVFALWLWIFVFIDARALLPLVMVGVMACLAEHHLWERWRLSLHPVRVHKNGIEFPPKNRKELRRGAKFVPFSGVGKVYISEYTAFELKNGRIEYVNNETLCGFDDFISVLRDRVNVERHAGWTLGIGVIWKRPDFFAVHELGLEMSWGDAEKRVAFDSLRGLGVGKHPTILHFRDGSRLAVDLDKDMSYQLADAWKNYQERFWKDPQAEEERWEKLEADE